MSVRRLFVTGPEEDRDRFHEAVAGRLLAHDRQGDTTYYSCLGDDLEFALQVAAGVDLTVQEIPRGHAEGTPYPVLRKGSHGMRWGKEVKQP